MSQFALLSLSRVWVPHTESTIRLVVLKIRTWDIVVQLRSQNGCVEMKQVERKKWPVHEVSDIGKHFV